MQIRKPFYAVLGFLVVLLVAAYLSPTPTAYVLYRVIILGFLVVLMTIFWAVSGLRGIEINRTARILRQQVGQVFEERIEVRNRSWLTRLWLEVRDLSSLPHKSGVHILSRIGKGQHRSFIARTVLTRRGAFLLGPTQISSGDPFGMFAVDKVFPGTHYLVVLPFFVNLDNFVEPPGKLPGGQARRLKSLEVTPYAAGVREYVPGDPLNRIHWRTTARKERLMVKEFEQDPLADVWIILDAQQGMHVSLAEEEHEQDVDTLWMQPRKKADRLPADTFEYCVSSAASVAKYFLDNGRPVGFACAGQTLSAIQAERGERQLAKILETLAFLKPEGKLPIEGLIESQSDLIPRGSTVVVISASPSHGIIVAQDVLLHKDLKPVFIFAEPSSFGAHFDVSEVVERLAAGRIPVIVIRKDDNLKSTLERVYLTVV